jgi:hypothetical protein
MRRIVLSVVALAAGSFSPLFAAPIILDQGAANAGTVHVPRYCKLELGTTANGFTASTMVESGTTACRKIGTRKNMYKCVDGKWVGTGQQC